MAQCWSCVLDAFHHVSDEPEILRLVSALLEHSPQNLRYIIACRSIPALPALATLGAQGHLGYLNSKDLVLTPKEVRSLLHSTFGIPRHRGGGRSADRPLGRGGPRASYCTPRPSGLAAVTPLLDGARVNDLLFQYLSAEVVAGQPQEFYDTLLQTSVLRFLTPSICQDVVGMNDPAHFLREVAQRNLFLTRVEGCLERVGIRQMMNSTTNLFLGLS